GGGAAGAGGGGGRPGRWGGGRGAGRLSSSPRAAGGGGNTERALGAVVGGRGRAPAGKESAEFRRLVRRNLAAWHRATPVLRGWVPGGKARFTGADGRSFVTWARKVLWRWEAGTGEPIGAPSGQSFPDEIYQVSEDGEGVVLGRGEAQHLSLRVVNARTGAPLGRACELPSAEVNSTLQVDLGAGNGVLVCWAQGERNTLRAFDVATG